MTKLYRIEGTFRYEGDEYECDVHSYGTLEVCTVSGVPEECDVDLEYVEINYPIKWDMVAEDWVQIDRFDIPESVESAIIDEASEHLRAGDYKEVGLIGVKE